MIEYYEMVKKLRDLIRSTDGPNSKIPAFKIMDLADELQEKAEELELQMIVDEQLSSKNSRYEYEFNS